jgi:hypothetical protein
LQRPNGFASVGIGLIVLLFARLVLGGALLSERGFQLGSHPVHPFTHGIRQWMRA